MSAVGRLVFAVPLKPRVVAADWGRVEENLRRTVHSARVSGGAGAEIVITGHDLPDLHEIDGPDVSKLVVPFDPPTTPTEGKRDKARKRRFIGAWLRDANIAREEVCVFFLDADDLVHRDLGAFIRATDAPSYVIDDGYVLATDRGLLIHYPFDFHRSCGSTFACRFSHDDLPVSWEDEDAVFSQFGSTPEQRGHQDYDVVAAELGRPPVVVPFAGVVYFANHPESLWITKGRPRRAATDPRLIVPARRARQILSGDFSSNDLQGSIAGSALTYMIAAKTAVSFGAERLRK